MKRPSWICPLTIIPFLFLGCVEESYRISDAKDAPPAPASFSWDETGTRKSIPGLPHEFDVLLIRRGGLPGPGTTLWEWLAVAANGTAHVQRATNQVERDPAGHIVGPSHAVVEDIRLVALSASQVHDIQEAVHSISGSVLPQTNYTDRGRCLDGSGLMTDGGGADLIIRTLDGGIHGFRTVGGCAMQPELSRLFGMISGMLP
jgi:hypothetical protein